MSVCADDNADDEYSGEVITTLSKFTGNVSEERKKQIEDRVRKLVEEEFANEEQEIKEMLEEAKLELRKQQAKSRNSASYYGSDLVLQGISVVIVTLTCVYGMFQ
ncbi:unnamed protein product [Trichobilharzia szidati]|nr:unnamed protein product [Trichobilharzia szidati]